MQQIVAWAAVDKNGHYEIVTATDAMGLRIGNRPPELPGWTLVKLTNQERNSEMNMRLTGLLLLSWARDTFGPVANDPKERAMRLLEEAAELAQAQGVSESAARSIIGRTYSRPVGDPFKETGAVMLTALSYCASVNIDPEVALETEVMRVLGKPKEHWRAKHDAKVPAGTSTGLSG